MESDIPNIEVTLEKVLDGYPLVYYEKPKDGEIPVPWPKVLVTTNCRQCNKRWQRETYFECIGFAHLVMCDECFPDDKITIVGSNKVWSNDSSE